MLGTAQILTLICFFAANDNNVEWNGCSHVGWQDRRPLCPINGESFSVLFRAYRFDLTSAVVHYDDGTTGTVVAVWDHDDGPYAIWRAQIPLTTANTLTYYIELIDGTDSDFVTPSGMSESAPPDGGWRIDRTTLEHAPAGATLVSGGGTVFKVWAPNAAQAWVRGTFNSWGTNNPMTRSGEYFVANVPAAHDRNQYKYYFDPGGIWKPDARGRYFFTPGGAYNTFVDNPFRYVWQSNSFTSGAFEDAIIYELHVGTFAGRNDPGSSGSIPATYRDAARHADHLAELGITMVELMPITEFPGDFSAGYNPITQWAPEARYGSPDDLKYLIDQLHQRGIGVMLDVVWNHISPSDNYLWHYDSATAEAYFHVPDIQTQWGSQADFSRGPVREFYQQSAQYWLDEFRIDGFRMDATDFMNIFPQEAEGWSLMQWYNDTLDNRWVHKLSVAEQLPNDSWITRPTSLGGAGFDAQWNDSFKYAIRNAVFAAAFGDPDINAIRNAINGYGPDLSGMKMANYVELHDEVLTTTGGSRLVNVIDTTPPHDDMWAKGRVKLAQGIMMLMPGIPMIFQGTEWLDDTNFSAGLSNGADRINWALKTQNAAIFQYFKDLIAVRKLNASFRANAGWQVFHVDDLNNVIAFQRWDNSGNVCVVVGSFNNNNLGNYRVGLPQAGAWSEILNSQASVYDGNNVGNGGAIQSESVAWDGLAQSATITIPQMGLLVFRWTPPAPCPGDLNASGTVDISDLATLLSSFGTASGATYEQGDLDSDGDVDLADLSAILSLFGTVCR